MTIGFLKTNSTALDNHINLVQLISEESTILEKETSPDRIKRHERILKFLIELQIYTARELV